MKPIDESIIKEAKALLAAGKRAPKPDQVAFGRSMDEIEVEMKQVKQQLEIVRARVEKETVESAPNEKRLKLRAQLDECKASQKEHEAKRTEVVEKLKAA